jgi:NAD(P)-dependent dehydrogenase (short-subunit alcohol dehydrogenase family)
MPSMASAPRVVVITGASAGVGRATVRLFAREGAAIALLARGRDRLEAAEREVEAAGGKALVLPVDVADAEAVEGAAGRAEAVFAAARNPRRELYVGWPTLKAVLGEKLAPGLLDLSLARTGFESQQTDERIRPDRPDNLLEPAPGDFAARCKFDERSKERSLQLWLTLNRGWLLAGAAAAAALSLRARE